MTRTTESTRPADLDSFDRPIPATGDRETVDLPVLAAGVSKISSARCIEEIGGAALVSLRELLVDRGRHAPVILGLERGERLEIWSTIRPERCSLDLGSFDLGLGRDRAPGAEHGAGEPMKEAVVAAFGLGEPQCLQWFRIGNPFLPRGALAVVSATPLAAPVASCVHILSSVCYIALERLDLSRELERADVERFELVDQLVRASEDERALLAGDLHDGPLQTLSALSYHLSLAGWQAAYGDGDEAAGAIDRAEHILREEIGKLRSLMMNLVPPSLAEGGLVAALREYVSRMALEYQDVALHIDAPDGEIGVREGQARILYRVAQEAIMNSLKHARASVIEISVRRFGHDIVVSVRDDGVGFDADDAAKAVCLGHIGLAYMRRRIELMGGRLEIQSNRGSGTTIEATVEIARD